MLPQYSNPIKVSHISPFKSRLTYPNNEYTVFIQYTSYIVCCIKKNIYNENIKLPVEISWMIRWVYDNGTCKTQENYKLFYKQ